MKPVLRLVIDDSPLTPIGLKPAGNPCRFCGILTYKSQKAHWACTQQHLNRKIYDANKALGQHIGEVAGDLIVRQVRP